MLDDENPVEKGQDNCIIIRFQYRELNEEEVKAYQVEGGSNTSKQEKINQKSFDRVLEEIKNTQIKALLMKTYKNDKPLLLYQLNRFSSKNTKDYFIHKNLKRFLSEQLDYFIKSEVLSIETLEKEKFLDKHITRAKVVKEIGEDIIDFLSQLEDFQKRLWEKKKFVINTEYVISLDKIKDYAGEDFLNEVIGCILKAQEQLKEWVDLGFGKVEKGDDLILKRDLTGIEYKKLPVDTKYFSQEFKEKLLEKLTENNELDMILDGLLIKSENWQALNLILEKYKEKVQTIYIDPPFNLEKNADFLYNVNYKDSAWITLLENRYLLAKPLLADTGSCFTRCDNNGNMFVRLLMNYIFGEYNFRNEITVRKTSSLSKREVNSLERETESLYHYCKNNERMVFNQLMEDRKKVEWVAMQEKPNRGQTGRPIIIEGKVFEPRKGWCWARGNEVANDMYKKGKLKIEKEKLYILLDKKIIGTNWTDVTGYTSY